MKVKSILFDSVFEKKFQKYKDKLTEKQKNILRDKLKIFKENIFDNSLKTHKLSWNLKDYYSFRIDYKNRLKFKNLWNWNVCFYDIWGHDKVY